MSSFLRWFVIVAASALLVLLIGSHEHGALKGGPVPIPNVLSSIAVAAIATAWVKYKFRQASASLAAPFVGGIAGSFATGTQAYGVYGAIVGLLAGTIIVLVPCPHISQPSSRST